MSNKRLFVTGGAGFIGSSFVAQRIKAGDEVVVFDALTYAGHRENLDWIEDPDENIELVVGDICDSEFVLRLLKDYKIDSVINFAAESHVDNSISGSAVFIDTNINGVYSLLEASRTYWDGLEGDKKDNFRFLQISTDEVYGSLELDAEDKFNEESTLKPNSPYSASKAAAEHLVRAWEETYGLPTLITNCTNNYGPRQHPEKLIPHMITCALSDKPLPIYGDGKYVRDWIHVEDHCDGIYLALTKGKQGETYCFAGNAEKNNNDVVGTLCEILDAEVPREDGKSYKEQITFVTDRLGHDRRYAIDDSKAIGELEYSRNFDFESGIKDTVKWYLDNSDWCEAVTGKKKVAA